MKRISVFFAKCKESLKRNWLTTTIIAVSWLALGWLKSFGIHSLWYGYPITNLKLTAAGVDGDKVKLIGSSLNADSSITLSASEPKNFSAEFTAGSTPEMMSWFLESNIKTSEDEISNLGGYYLPQENGLPVTWFHS